MERGDLAVEIVRFVDDYQPGIVECQFTDAKGHRHTIIEKVPIVTGARLDANSEFPQEGLVGCVVLGRWRDVDGRELLRISTDKPDAVETDEGLSEFVVLASQIRAT